MMRLVQLRQLLVLATDMVCFNLRLSNQVSNTNLGIVGSEYSSKYSWLYQDSKSLKRIGVALVYGGPQGISCVIDLNHGVLGFSSRVIGESYLFSSIGVPGGAPMRPRYEPFRHTMG